jgi:hypothetical protein
MGIGDLPNELTPVASGDTKFIVNMLMVILLQYT